MRFKRRHGFTLSPPAVEMLTVSTFLGSSTALLLEGGVADYDATYDPFLQKLHVEVSESSLFERHAAF